MNSYYAKISFWKIREYLLEKKRRKEKEITLNRLLFRLRDEIERKFYYLA